MLFSQLFGSCRIVVNKTGNRLFRRITIMVATSFSSPLSLHLHRIIFIIRLFLLVAVRLR